MVRSLLLITLLSPFLSHVTADFDDKAAVMGEWFDCSSNNKKRSKGELDRNFSLEYIKKNDSLQTSFHKTPGCSRRALRERIAARSGFSAPRLNIKDIDDKAAVMGEWFDCSPNNKKRSEGELDRNFSLEYIKKADSLQTSFHKTPGCSRGALPERIAARSGFSAPWLNIKDIDDKASVMGEWFDCSPNNKKRSKGELDRNFSLEYIKKDDSLQTSFHKTPGCSRGALRERIAARSGFSAPRLNIKDIFQSTCLTISSPGVSPATLLESPVFLSNPLPSPTTGKFSTLPSDKAKDELFDDITTSLAFQSISGSSLDPANIGLEPDDSQDYEQQQLGGLGDSMASEAPADDGYNWRKYGQKLVKGSEYPRSYYKCTHPNCEVKKKVERSREGHIIEIIYVGSHNHPKRSPNRRSGIGSSGTGLDMQIDGTEQEGFAGTNENIEWTSPASELKYGSHSRSMQVKSGTQFGYGDAAADAIFRDEDDRASHMSVSLSYNGEVDEYESKRRKLEAYPAEMSGLTRASHEPRVVVQVTSDIDILDDGYRWRKYGQKVVKGNPNPRSYYKCTANGCTVTKHVERASDDFKSVLTTYIGKHTHVVPAARNSSHVGSGSSGTLQGGLATQTRNHNVHYPVPHSRSEGLEKLPNQPALDIGDPAGLMLQLTAEPKVEPVSQQGLGLPASSLIYREILSRLPHI